MNQSFLISLLGIIAGTAVLTIIQKMIFNRLCRTDRDCPSVWIESAVHAVRFPLQLYTWVAGAIFSIALIEQELMEEPLITLSFLKTFHRIAAFIMLIWAFWRYVDRFEHKGNIKYNRTTVQGFSNAFKIAILSMGLLGVLQFAGIPISGVIAFGGVGGIAIGFAAKDLLANFFGGMTIFLDHLFQIGDWIRSPDREIEGTVEHIGWRLTRIRTAEQKQLFVPNSVFTTIAVENASRIHMRKMKATLHLSYEDALKVEDILRDIEKMMKSHPQITPSGDCFANLVEFGPFSLVILITAFTKTTEGIAFQRLQQEIFLKAIEIVHGHGAKIGEKAALRYY